MNYSYYQNPYALRRKYAAAPPMDPAMMGGGAMPPMDPAMMGGGAMPPMDPAMMGGAMPPMDPAMMGGGAMPPMDPAMMGGAMPPMDPSMGGMPPAAPPPGDPAADPAAAGDPAAGGKKNKKQDLEERQARVENAIYNMQIMLASIMKALDVPFPVEAAIMPPGAGGTDISNPMPKMVEIAGPAKEVPAPEEAGAPLPAGAELPLGGEMPKTGGYRPMTSLDYIMQQLYGPRYQ